MVEADERSDAESRTLAAAAVPFAPNVKLAAGAEPLGSGPITVGMETLDPIPDADKQRAGFYYKKAKLLVRLFPNHFKLMVDKGR